MNETIELLNLKDIKFELRGKEYSIGPILVKDYYLIQDYVMFEEFDTQINVITSLSGCPEEELRKLEKHQFSRLWATVYNERFLPREKKPFHKVVELNGKPYGFIHIDKISIGEFADLDVIATSSNKEKRLHEMMAILYRPMKQWNKKVTYYEVEPYDHDECLRRSSEFLELPLDVVHGAMSFFLTIQNTCTVATLVSLEKTLKNPEEKEMVKESIKLFHQLGAGFDLSSSSQEEILSSLSRLQDLASKLALVTPPTSRTKPEKKESKLRRFVSSMLHKEHKN